MAQARIAAVNLECTDPLALATFWARLLDGKIMVETPEYCAVQVGDLFLGAAQVVDYRPPTWPSAARSQQLHLDLAVDDLDAAEHAAIELGATKLHHQARPESFRVLRDPAGHPFCLRS
ncbi:VOC family protein [Microlunatus sp. GCM10028923]|uniref:VOC family protein n=1 Tax=Microlunatus sp. GCM10028923 TaxID=3273400 RepID=UPI00362317D4